MLPIETYFSKMDLQSLSNSQLESLIHYFQIPDASPNDTLWLLALRIHAPRGFWRDEISQNSNIISSGQSAQNSRSGKFQMPELEDLPPEMVYQICLQATIPTLQRFVATSTRHRDICEEILEKKIDSYKKVTKWLNENTRKYKNITWQELTKLDVLQLARSQLSNLPAEIGDLTNLKDLHLRYNQLSSLPATIGGLTNLETLWLNNNRLSNLPTEIGDLSSLTALYLSNNQLDSLPAEIGKLTNLEELDLRNNQLNSLSTEIGHLTKLEELYLNGNRLSNLPKEIGQLINLVFLELKGNQLNSLPADIGKLTKLEFLDLRNNRLTDLPKEIKQLTNLKKLNLGDNQLSNQATELLKQLPKSVKIVI